MGTPAKQVDLVVITDLYKEFTDALGNVKEQTTLKRLSEAIQISKDYLRKLKDYITPFDFRNEGDEIHFFKHHKPNFSAHLFYYSGVYHIEINKPIGSSQSQKEYFQSELNNLTNEFEKNRRFYTYLREEATYNDTDYFVRGHQNAVIIEKYFVEVDHLFSTGYDFLVANYLAMDKIAGYLNKKIVQPANSPVSFETPKHASKIVWTDSKTALIELVYAFKAKGSFNNGRATLKDITDHIQQIFGIELTNPTRDFQEILRRKTGYTIYLDGLKECYLQYIDKIETRDRR